MVKLKALQCMCVQCFRELWTGLKCNYCGVIFCVTCAKRHAGGCVVKQSGSEHMEFEKFHKIPRYSRDIVITEKLDGTNAQVYIELANELPDNPEACCRLAYGMENYHIYAGSRSRWLHPEKGKDNHGFASWVCENMTELVKLGPGRHFGEWWGKGIQRGYGLEEKRFSLFNTGRWENRHIGGLSYIGDGMVGDLPATGKVWAPSCCHVVPVLYIGPNHEYDIRSALTRLRMEGSNAAPGFMNPEGIVIYHTASGTMFKKTIEGDEKPKGPHTEEEA